MPYEPVAEGKGTEDYQEYRQGEGTYKPHGE